MKLVKLKEETPSYEGKFWSYAQRKFLPYDEWIKEGWCDGSKENVKSKRSRELHQTNNEKNSI